MRFWGLLLTLILLSTPALAQEDAALRVRLDSLGAVSQLELTAQADYVLGESAGFQLLEGAQVTAVAQSGEVWIVSGGLKLNLGEEIALVRCSSGGIEAAGRLYLGDLTLSAEGDRLRAILNIDIEEYLCGVVGCEMSDSFPIEALKAQAVAARTYAMRKKAQNASRDYDLTDTTADQVFGGYNPELQNVIAAVSATRGVVGVYEGDYAACYYTASNGGRIAAPEEVWGGEGGMIEAKDDPYDLENPRSLVNEIEFRADLSDCAALKRMLEDKCGATVAQVQSIEIDGDEARFFTDAGEVRLDLYEEIKDGLHLGLNKGDYERASVQATQDGFLVQMRGFGHCVGMSQRGAQWMASEYQMSWREILAFYYPNMELQTREWDAFAPTALESIPALSLSTQTLAADESCGVVCASVLNVRRLPNAESDLLGTLEQGRAVVVEEAREDWLRIRTSSLSGWVCRKYIRFS